jgi:hypothetical protein
MEHRGWGHSYFKHVDAYSKLSKPRALGEHGEKATFSSWSRLGAPRQHRA